MGTSGYWEEWPYGQFYDNVIEVCKSCENSCKGPCAYQEKWLACSADQYLDLDTLKCVTECNSTSTISIVDEQFGSRSICRSLKYYVNPESTSVVELGTQTHPYKNLGFVFVEILNYHSNADRNISIFVMEKTTNHLYLYNNNIANTTNVDLLTYSSNSSVTSPEKAVLISHDHAKLSSTQGTRFNILSNFDLR